MKKLLGKLFGGGGGSTPQRGAGVAHEGFVIYPAVQPEGSQWRVAGVIAKEDGEEPLEHPFVRADLLSSRDEAEEFTVRKAKQIIKERGARLFAATSSNQHG